MIQDLIGLRSARPMLFHRLALPTVTTLILPFHPPTFKHSDSDATTNDISAILPAIGTATPTSWFCLFGRVIYCPLILILIFVLYR